MCNAGGQTQININANTYIYKFTNTTDNVCQLINTDNENWCQLTDSSTVDNQRTIISFLRTAIYLVDFPGE